MVTYRKVIDRYCPSKEHNVKIEICHHDDGRLTERCMHLSCKQDQCNVYRNEILATMRKSPKRASFQEEQTR